jgi:glyoxylase-like metal-dependent hydrolase (beta-lactamase superfamily II)
MTSVSHDSPPRERAPAVTAEGESFASDPKRLRYAEVAIPASGKSVEVAPGVRWARIPLPMDLNHINVWLIDTHDGCIVVDTGMAASMGKEAWESIAADVFATKPLRGVFVTHIHPDHIGLAAWLQERHGVPVTMSRRTYEMASMMLDAGAQTPFSDAEKFFRANGLTELEQMLPMFKPDRFIRMASGLPRVERFVADNEVAPFSGEWTAMETNGHAEGHLCLSNAAARTLISGDQVLPTISSNISFTFRSGDTNPLGSYLSSLERLRTLPTETLVLPSHGAPFYGLQQRIDDLTRHHHEQLEKVLNVCAEPRTAADLLPHMFRRELKGMHLYLALGEAVAHLEYLVHAGRLARRTTDDVVRYVALEAVTG